MSTLELGLVLQQQRYKTTEMFCIEVSQTHWRLTEKSAYIGRRHSLVIKSMEFLFQYGLSISIRFLWTKSLTIFIWVIHVTRYHSVIFLMDKNQSPCLFISFDFWHGRWTHFSCNATLAPKCTFIINHLLLSVQDINNRKK